MLVTLLPAGGQATQVATATASSAVVDITKTGTYLGNIGFQVVAVGLNTADATVYIEHSNDGTNFSTVDNSTLTLASGSSNQCMILTNQAFAFYRVTFNKGTNSAGTYSITVNFN